MAQQLSKERQLGRLHPFIPVYGEYVFRAPGLTLETLRKAVKDHASFAAYIPKLDGKGWHTLHDIKDTNIRVQLLDRALDKFPEIAGQIREEFPDDFKDV